MTSWRSFRLTRDQIFSLKLITSDLWILSCNDMLVQGSCSFMTNQQKSESWKNLRALSFWDGQVLGSHDMPLVWVSYLKWLWVVVNHYTNLDWDYRPKQWVGNDIELIGNVALTVHNICFHGWGGVEGGSNVLLPSVTHFDQSYQSQSNQIEKYCLLTIIVKSFVNNYLRKV